MRKRIMPALLSITLVLSLIPTAFAAFPMTLVQQTTGDVNKEFVYYIRTDDVDIDINSNSNVEIITVTDVRCMCGALFFRLDPDFNTKYYEHYDPLTGCFYHNIDVSYTVYKITLKNGEKIALNVKNVQPKKIYTIREDNYSMSYLIRDGEVSVLQDESLVGFAFTPIIDGTFSTPLTNGILTLKRTNPNAVPKSAKPTNDALWVNGQRKTATVYKIDGSNYFKIRDLAAVLNGTSKQFSVGYDAASKSVTATSGKAYTPVGGELSGPASGNQTATVSMDTILVNGALAKDVTVYKIAGNNYFKLRDLGDALGFGVDYEAGKGMLVTIGD